jgi:hypothetical protein
MRLEIAQQQVYGVAFDIAFVPNFTVRGWLGELMLEVGRPRDAERYFKSLSRDPFAALQLGKVYLLPCRTVAVPVFCRNVRILTYRRSQVQIMHPLQAMPGAVRPSNS